MLWNSLSYRGYVNSWVQQLCPYLSLETGLHSPALHADVTDPTERKEKTCTMGKQGTTRGCIFLPSLFDGPAPSIASAASGRNLKMAIAKVSQFRTLFIRTTANTCL